MNEWLKSHTYIAEWLGVVAGYLAIVVGIFIAAYPVIKGTVKSVATMFAVWLVVSSTFMLMRLTMSQEAIKDMLKSLLLLACVYAVFQSTQNGLKTQSQRLA